ncbi:hypothetical protein BKA81DRAFT_195191 [Phyllosticta paracitricarpa]
MRLGDGRRLAVGMRWLWLLGPTVHLRIRPSSLVSSPLRPSKTFDFHSTGMRRGIHLTSLQLRTTTSNFFACFQVLRFESRRLTGLAERTWMLQRLPMCFPSEFVFHSLY